MRERVEVIRLGGRKGKAPDGSVYVGRQAPGLKRSPLHNQWRVKDGYTLEGVLKKYRQHLQDHPELIELGYEEIWKPGLDVACWCELPQDGEVDLCHGRVLLDVIEEYANAREGPPDERSGPTAKQGRSQNQSQGNSATGDDGKSNDTDDTFEGPAPADDQPSDTDDNQASAGQVDGAADLADLHPKRQADLIASGATVAGMIEAGIMDWYNRKGWGLRWRDGLPFQLDGDEVTEFYVLVPDRGTGGLKNMRRIGDNGEPVKVEWPSKSRLPIGSFPNVLRRVPGAGKTLAIEGARQMVAGLSWAPTGVNVVGLNGIDGLHGGIVDRLDWAEGQTVYITPDADHTSNHRVGGGVKRVAKHLYTAGAESVRQVDLSPYKQEDNDGLDDILARLPEEERTQFLVDLIAAAEEVVGGRRRLRVQQASDIKPRATRWLWREDDGSHWLPLGGMVLEAGREGVGKSTITYGIAAKVTRGELPGAFFGTPRSVVVAATEDAWEQTVVPRLLAAGADLERVFRVDAETPEGLPEAVKLPDDLVLLERLIRAKDVALILLDPLIGSISGKLDSHKDHDIRVALEPVSRLAHDTQTTIVGLIHENKSGAADLLNRIMASRAFAAVARGVLYAALDNDMGRAAAEDADKLDGPGKPGDQYLFGQIKNNLAAKVAYTLRYHIEGRHVGHDDDLDEPVWSSVIVWDGKVESGLQEIIRQQDADARDVDKNKLIDRACDWLRDYLADKPDGMAAATVKRDGKREREFGERLLMRARERIGAEVRSQATSTGRHTFWSLPPVTTVINDTTVSTVTTVTTPDDQAISDSEGGRDNADGGDGTSEGVVTTPNAKAQVRGDSDSRDNVTDTGDSVTTPRPISCSSCGTRAKAEDLDKPSSHLGGASCAGYQKRSTTTGRKTR